MGLRASEWVCSMAECCDAQGHEGVAGCLLGVTTLHGSVHDFINLIKRQWPQKGHQWWPTVRKTAKVG